LRAEESGVRRIAVLTAYVESDSEAQRRVGIFRQRLEELGWRKGSLDIDYRWAAGDVRRFLAYAAELVALKPSVILAAGEAAVVAVQRASRTIPIVFVQIDDPLGTGLVQSLARPGENLTGFTPFEFALGGKLLQVLKEAATRTTEVTVLLRPGAAMHTGTLRVIEASGPLFGVRVTAAGVHDIAEIEHAIDAVGRKPNGGLIVLSYALANVHRKRIIGLAAHHGLPTIYPFRHYVADGGLISYGADPADQFRDAASYIDRILRGEKAGDLPVQAPTKYELVINLKTARALGLDVPPTLLARADEVIE
jgi:putative ABC transport system substrate-binding protein